MCKVSIFMSSYNYAKYLPDAIDSVLNQTFQDFELFIMDDASTDESWQIIQSFSDPRIIPHKNPVNQHSVDGFNKFISQIAKGDLIALHHSDNYWEPDKLQKQVDFLKTHQEIGAVFTSVKVIDENGDPLKDKSNQFFEIFEQPNRNRYEWLNFFFHFCNGLCHPTILIRKQCYTDCGLFQFGLGQLPDLDMWVRLCLQYEIHILQEKLVSYRIMSNNQNISGNRPESRIRHQFEYLKILDHYLKIPTFQEFVKVFPSAQKYYRSDGYDLGFILGLTALEERGNSETFQLFGQSLLLEAIQDQQRRKKIQELYGFTYKDFIKLTGQNDIFSIKKMSDFNERLNSNISQLKNMHANQKAHISTINLLNMLVPHDSFRYKMLKHFNKKFLQPIFFYKNLQDLKSQKLLISSSGLFDREWYLENNPDVAESNIDPCEHYIIYGGLEGRDPGPDFSSQMYLDKYEDVKKSKTNPLVHYLRNRKEEG